MRRQFKELTGDTANLKVDHRWYSCFEVGTDVRKNIDAIIGILADEENGSDRARPACLTFIENNIDEIKIGACRYGGWSFTIGIFYLQA